MNNYIQYLLFIINCTFFCSIYKINPNFSYTVSDYPYLKLIIFIQLINCINWNNGLLVTSFSVSGDGLAHGFHPSSVFL